MAWGYIPMSVFDKNGVEFTDDEGVRVRKQQVRIYSGKAGYRQLLDHIYETVRKSGGRVRQFNFGDEKYLPYADDFVSAHLERMADIKNLDAKVLAVEGDKNLLLSYCAYRWLPKNLAGLAPFYLYNDYIIMSLNETGNRKEFLTIHSKLLAERYAAQFDVFWGMGAEKKGLRKG